MKNYNKKLFYRFLAGIAAVNVKTQDEYDQFMRALEKETILKWLTTFCRRFFNQQFKRSCLPDGPKIGTVALSPRGDWRMPSDACAQVWMRDLEKISL